MSKKRFLAIALIATTLCLCACGDKAATDTASISGAAGSSEAILSEDGTAPQELSEAAANWKKNTMDSYIEGYPYPYFNVKYEERAMDIDGDGVDEYQVGIRLWGDVNTVYTDTVLLKATDKGVVEFETDNYYFFNGYKLANGKYAEQETFTDGYIYYLYSYDEKNGFVEEAYLDYYVENDSAQYSYGKNEDDYNIITEDEYNKKFAELFKQEGAEEYCNYTVVTSEEYQYTIEK